MELKEVDINSIILNPKNPRIIKDDKFKKLCKSIKDFPEMLNIRPIVVDENMMVLGGNMRLKACKELKLDKVPICYVNELTEEQKNEFIIKDNNSFGEWDYKELGNWDKELLLNGGFEIYDMIGIFGDNELTNKFKGNIEGSNFNPDNINVDDYVKQNILFFNDLMIEFEDDNIKQSIKNIKNKEEFINDIKKIILKYGKNII
jgi:hypothetical protein